MSEELNQSPSEEAVAPTLNSVADLQPKMKLTGTVKQIEQYGAFIDLGLETAAMAHISQLSRGNVNRVADVLSIGQEVTVWVQEVDTKLNQIMVSMIEPNAVDWNDLEKGNVYTGTIIRLESFGAFIDIGAEREGLAHVSELSHEYIKHPSQVLTAGEEVQVKVLDFSKRKKRINLSIKALLEAPEEEGANAEDMKAYEKEEVEEVLPTAIEIAFRRAQLSASPSEADRANKTTKVKKRRKSLRKQQEDLLNRTLTMTDSGKIE